MLCSDADTRKPGGVGGNSIVAGFLQQQSPQQGGGRSHQQQVMDKQGAAEDGVQGVVVR